MQRRLLNVYFALIMTWLHAKLNYFKNNFEIISVFYFTCNHHSYIVTLYFTCNVWNWNKIISAAEEVLKLFQNYFSDNEHGQQ